MSHHPMGADIDPNPRFVAEDLVDESAMVMGKTAENLHDENPHLTRDMADGYALQSAYARRRLRLRRRAPGGHGLRRGAGDREGPRAQRLTVDDLHVIELHEAFAIECLVFLEHFDLPLASDKVNPYGGTIAVGHPLAMTGNRLVMQLAHYFDTHDDARLDISALCVGFGMGATILWENV
jgi:hypothetical protein